MLDSWTTALTAITTRRSSQFACGLWLTIQLQALTDDFEDPSPILGSKQATESDIEYGSVTVATFQVYLKFFDPVPLRDLPRTQAWSSIESDLVTGWSVIDPSMWKVLQDSHAFATGRIFEKDIFLDDFGGIAIINGSFGCKGFNHTDLVMNAISELMPYLAMSKTPLFVAHNLLPAGASCHEQMAILAASDHSAVDLENIKYAMIGSGKGAGVFAARVAANAGWGIDFDMKFNRTTLPQADI